MAPRVSIQNPFGVFIDDEVVGKPEELVEDPVPMTVVRMPKTSILRTLKLLVSAKKMFASVSINTAATFDSRALVALIPSPL